MEIFRISRELPVTSQVGPHRTSPALVAWHICDLSTGSTGSTVNQLVQGFTSFCLVVPLAAVKPLRNTTPSSVENHILDCKLFRQNCVPLKCFQTFLVQLRVLFRAESFAGKFCLWVSKWTMANSAWINHNAGCT